MLTPRVALGTVLVCPQGVGTPVRGPCVSPGPRDCPQGGGIVPKAVELSPRVWDCPQGCGIVPRAVGLSPFCRNVPQPRSQTPSQLRDIVPKPCHHPRVPVALPRPRTCPLLQVTPPRHQPGPGFVPSLRGHPKTPHTAHRLSQLRDPRPCPAPGRVPKPQVLSPAGSWVAARGCRVTKNPRNPIFHTKTPPESGGGSSASRLPPENPMGSAKILSPSCPPHSGGPDQALNS